MTRDPARSARIVVVLGVLTGLAPLAIDMYLPAFPELARDLGSTASQVQLTLTACLIGLTIGQLVVGPISDRRGRRAPLLAGLTLYVAASLLCAAAPSIELLIAARFVQGATGAAGIVLANAVVRDLHSGDAASRYFSKLMLVNGAAPILAPLLGAQVLLLGSWRLVFVALGGLGLVTLVAAARILPETLPPPLRIVERRRGASYAQLLRDPAFMATSLASGFSIGAMFAYIAGSSFVLQEIYGLGPQRYAAAFAVNALSIVALGQLSGRLVGRVASSAQLLVAGTTLNAVGGVALLASMLLDLGLAGILPSLLCLVGSLGLVLPNSTALAMEDHPRIAGAASALLGAMRYIVGGVVAPLVGLGGSAAQLPMGIVIASCSVAALACGLLAARLHLRLLQPAATLRP